jgi:hypothetical protein
MRSSRITASVAAMVALAMSACMDREPVAPDATTRFAHEGTHAVTVVVRGEDGTDICNTLPAEAGFWVEMLSDTDATQEYVACPANTALLEWAGEGWLNVGFDEPYGAYPLVYYRPTPVTITKDAAVGLRVREGRRLGGQTTFEGQPTDMGVVNVRFYTPSGDEAWVQAYSTGPSGTWTMLDAPFHLQRNLETLVRCQALSRTRLAGTSERSGIFPADFGSLSCKYRYSLARRYTHYDTGLALTVGPGSLGEGHGAESGWEGLYPAEPGVLALHESGHIHDAHLVVTDGTTLFSVDPEFGALLAPVAGPAVRAYSGTAMRVRWELSAPMGDGTLEVRQASWDGGLGHDFVLLRYTFVNLSSSAVTLGAGLRMDWDVVGSTDDAVATGLNNRLMYATGNGTFVGTYFITSGKRRNYAGLYGEFDTDLVTQVLTGAASQLTAGPDDIVYVHGLGDIAVAAGGTKSIWAAVLAAGSLAELETV